MKKLFVYKISIWLFLAGFLISDGYAQVNKSSASKAKELFSKGQDEEALIIYRDLLEADSSDYEALWNTVIIYSNKGKRQKNDDDRHKYIDKSMEYAKKLLQVYPDSGHSHYAYAVALARKSEVMGTRGRIRAAHEIHDHIEKASDLIPDFALVWHLYGVWHSDVANVSRGARLAARFVSSGLPDASNEKAEEYMLKAIQMNPENILMKLDLARHYVEVKRHEDAASVVKNLLQMEPKMKDDPAYQEEARQILEALD